MKVFQKCDVNHNGGLCFKPSHAERDVTSDLDFSDAFHLGASEKVRA